MSRFGFDTVSQETTDTINDHRYIIERDQFSSSTILNPITESAPQTPPYSGYSSNESEPPEFMSDNEDEIGEGVEEVEVPNDADD